MPDLQKKELSAENTFTDPYLVESGQLPVFVHVEGTWKGTITIQMLIPGDDAWFDMNNTKSSFNFETHADVLPIKCQIRAGFKTGDHASGTAIVRVFQ